MKPVSEEDDDLFDEKGMLKDGCVWRVPMRMTDSLQRAIERHAAAQFDISIADGVGHRPGFVTTDARSVADRQRAYDEYDAVSNAWKSGCTSLPDRPRSERQDDARDARQAAYAEYDA